MLIANMTAQCTTATLTPLAATLGNCLISFCLLVATAGVLGLLTYALTLLIRPRPVMYGELPEWAQGFIWMVLGIPCALTVALGWCDFLML